MLKNLRKIEAAMGNASWADLAKRHPQSTAEAMLKDESSSRRFCSPYIAAESDALNTARIAKGS